MVSRTSGSDVTQRRLLRRVVLATDFSSRASRAVRRVQYLPFALGAEVVLAHVLPPKDSIKQKVESVSRSRLDRQADRLRRGLERLACPHVAVRAVLVSGAPAVEIAKIAQESSADLLVVGRHGAGTLKDLLLGSTAERLIHDSQVSVLIVSLQPAGSYQTPVIALPHGEPARFVLDTALRVVPVTLRTLDIASAVSVPIEGWLWAGWASTNEILRLRALMRQRARRMLEQTLAPYRGEGLGFRVTLRDGDPRRVIVRVASRRTSDLLVVGSHTETSMVRLRLGSVATHIVRHASCDVLVARPSPVAVEAG